jgi:site-specific DNA-cytosine methylase
MSKEKNSKQMSLLEDFPANQCQSQETKKEQVTTDISGQTCLELLGKSNPNSLLGRMCKELLTSKTAWYSDRCKMTWKVKVSKSNVSLFQLQASVLGTKGTEFGLLATPNTMDHLPRRAEESFKQQIRSGQRKNRKRPGNLREQIDPVVVRWAIEARLESNKVPKEKWTEMFQQYQKDQMKLYPKSMYPTPQVDDSKNVNPSPKRRMTLAKHVKMYPTPQRSDHLANQSETLKAWKKRATEKKKQGINLQFALRHAVQMYPTPTVDCEEGGRDAVFGEKQNVTHSNSERQQEQRRAKSVQKKRDESQCSSWWKIESDFRGVPNGISYELDKGRVNRIKALGNAIVPQIAREIGLAIKKVL